MLTEMFAAAGMATMARIKTVEEQVFEALKEIDPKINSIRFAENWPKDPESNYLHSHYAHTPEMCYAVHDGSWQDLIEDVRKRVAEVSA